LALGRWTLQKIENDGDIASHRRAEIARCLAPGALSSEGFGRGNQEPRQEALVAQNRLGEEGRRRVWLDHQMKRQTPAWQIRNAVAGP
jgi:hypothetical protein